MHRSKIYPLANSNTMPSNLLPAHFHFHSCSFLLDELDMIKTCIGNQRKQESTAVPNLPYPSNNKFVFIRIQFYSTSGNDHQMNVSGNLIQVLLELNIQNIPHKPNQ